MTHYFEIMREVIEFHGGTVEKFIGDAVMAVFGVPTVHEDDALRACRAAVEIRERLDAMDVISAPRRAPRSSGGWASTPARSWLETSGPVSAW